MGCYVEFSEPKIRFKFSENKLKQKSMIDALLTHTRLTRKQLADILNISEPNLQKVSNNQFYLEQKQFDQLCQYFLVSFGS